MDVETDDRRHTYIPTYIHTCIHTHIHTYTHTYIHTHMHTYIHTYIHGSSCERFKRAANEDPLVRQAPGEHIQHYHKKDGPGTSSSRTHPLPAIRRTPSTFLSSPFTSGRARLASSSGFWRGLGLLHCQPPLPVRARCSGQCPLPRIAGRF